MLRKNEDRERENQKVTESRQAKKRKKGDRE